MLTTNRLQKRKHATVFEPEFEPEGNILKLPTLHDHDDASGFMLLRETAQKFQDSNDFALHIDSPAAQSGNYAGHTRRLSGVSQDVSSPAKKQMRCMCCKGFGRNIRTCKSRTQTSSSHKRPLKVTGLWCRVASRRRCGARGRWQMETCVRRARDTTHGDHVRLKIKGMKVDANFIYISS